MKKIKLLSLVVILISFVFSSCNSSLTITKRHSKRGYYVATNKIKKAHVFKNDKQELTELNTSEDPISDPLATTLENKENTSNLKGEDDKSTKTITLKENKSSDVVGELNSKAKPEKKTDKSLIEKVKAKTKTINTIQKSAFKAKKAVAPSSGHDALSLLWIVIVIILILWLLGLILGNLGSLIHLLLVIALILLILWLLKVI